LLIGITPWESKNKIVKTVPMPYEMLLTARDGKFYRLWEINALSLKMAGKN